jgi:hypothetical protein
VNIYYGLTTQLVWVKIVGGGFSADNYVLVLDEDNFKKLMAQANELLTKE